MVWSDLVYWMAVKFKMTDSVKQQICIKFCVKLEHSSMKTIWMIQKNAAMGNWATGDWQLHHNNMPTHASRLVQSVLGKHQITQVTQSPRPPQTRLGVL